MTIRWFSLAVLTINPALSLYGLLHVPFTNKTLAFALTYYLFSMIGITAGYHRLWSHRSYMASTPLKFFLILGGSSAIQGSCLWWARKHRCHHRYTDTDLDPYNAKRGLLWTHIGWMIFYEHRGVHVDMSDLQKDPVVQWQHRFYFPLLILMGYLIPTFIPGLFWNDWAGGFFYAAMLRSTLVHHSTFCINSIAHYLGHAPYDDKLSPRDHFLSALLTLGEGYHNFHHQFPMDYRNAFRWYQYDPTKWFIRLCNFLGLAGHLRVFPSNEIEKGALSMKLKTLKNVQDSLVWPPLPEELPIVNWETFKRDSQTRVLILVSGFIHDASAFVEQHPGGASLLARNSGSDMTAAFFGGVYDHSHAAHNLLAMMRVGILHGGVESHTEQQSISPSQRLYIAVALN